MAIFTNYATLTYNGNSVNSNVVTGEIQEALTINKTALTETYTQGDTVTYVVNVINSGGAVYNGLMLTDDLGAYAVGGQTVYPLTYRDGSVRYFVDGEPMAAPTVADTQPLTVTGLTIPAGAIATLVYQADVNEFAPLMTGGEITNTVTLSGTGVTPITAEETITVTAGPRLTITKALSPTVVTENGQLTYTFTIQNFGNAPVTEETGAVLTDTFDPALDLVSVTFNGTEWSAPLNYNYVATDGLFTTVAGAITVDAATYTQNPDGSYTVTPGVSTLVIVGNII
ncbi:MAG: DUF11 domain-containing protein [Clostridia bacterium]|nr:DUF11 domain-containing protein [Clostridia bacterium]